MAGWWTTVLSLRLLSGTAKIYGWLVGPLFVAVVLANLSAAGLFGGGRGPLCVDQICTAQPSFAQWLAHLGAQLTGGAFELLALLLLLRFLRTAGEDGPYSPLVPGRLRTLSWFLLAGGPLAGLVSGVSTAALRASVLTSTSPVDDLLNRWANELHGWAIVAGVAGLMFASFITVGVRMREDLEGTI